MGVAAHGHGFVALLVREGCLPVCQSRAVPHRPGCGPADLAPHTHSHAPPPPLCRRADGPLLAAVRSGAWVLLDELNLAGQTVLEGLNAVLDHRAEVSGQS